MNSNYKFNPFEYILILDEFLKNPILYKNKEDTLKDIMNTIKDNKDEEIETFIVNVEKKINETVGGATVDAFLTTEQVDANISHISDKNLKNMVENKIEHVSDNTNLVTPIDVTEIEAIIYGLTAAINQGKVDENIDDILSLTNYGLKYLLECQSILQDKASTLGIDINKEMNEILNIINAIIREAKKFESEKIIPPDGNFDKILNDVEIYHKKTNETLKKILNIKDDELISVAAKAIMASSIIFSAFTYLSIDPPKTYQNTTNSSNTIKTIIEDDIKLIRNKSQSTGEINSPSNSDSDINKSINDTIFILKQKCSSTHMMDTFVYVVEQLETANPHYD